MHGSSYIWGFLVPASILLFVGFYLSAQLSGAVKLTAALQIDQRARNKIIKRRGLQIGLFFKVNFNRNVVLQRDPIFHPSRLQSKKIELKCSSASETFSSRLSDSYNRVYNFPFPWAILIKISTTLNTIPSQIHFFCFGFTNTEKYKANDKNTT